MRSVFPTITKPNREFYKGLIVFFFSVFDSAARLNKFTELWLEHSPLDNDDSVVNPPPPQKD